MSQHNAFTCGGCGSSLQNDDANRGAPCLSCGSTARVHGMVLNFEATGRASLGLKAKHEGATGKHKWFVEAFEGWSLFKLTNTWHSISRRIDRSADRYVEIIKDEDGTVIKHCDEPLSEHRGHGDAKLRSDESGS